MFNTYSLGNTSTGAEIKTIWCLFFYVLV